MRFRLSGWVLPLLCAAAGAGEPPRVLFLTHSAGYRHEVVTRPGPATLALAETQLQRAAGKRFVVDCTQDCGTITRENLARYAAVVFYTPLGHRPEVWKDERFLRHVVGGLEWATVSRDEEGFVALDDLTSFGNALVKTGRKEVALLGMGDGSIVPTEATARVRELPPNTHLPAVLRRAVEDYEIQAVGHRYTVWVNGKLVNVFDGERSRKGHIGLQNHDDASRVQYRNIRVVELD